MRIAVFSDVHSNFYALKATLTEIKSLSVDRIVFLGDLLTYGCDVSQTIDLVKDFTVGRNVDFIYGNHDKIYFNKQDGKEYRYKNFPDFIEESICYTYDNLDCKLVDCFDWKPSLIIENMFFSHANTLGNDDWSYLNSVDDIRCAAHHLSKIGLSGGFFGHTHRGKISQCKVTGVISEESVYYTQSQSSGSVFIANSGSVGQPRGNASSYLLVDLNNDGLKIKQCYFDFALDSHLNSIMKSSLSNNTKDKLISFFKCGKS